MFPSTPLRALAVPTTPPVFRKGACLLQPLPDGVGQVGFTLEDDVMRPAARIRLDDLDDLRVLDRVVKPEREHEAVRRAAAISRQRHPYPGELRLRAEGDL